MITISSAIAGLIISLGSFIIGNAEPKRLEFIFILIAGMAVAVLSIAFFIWAFVIRYYKNPVTSRSYFNYDKTNRKKEPEFRRIDAMRHLFYSDKHMKMKMTEWYLISIEHNMNMNVSKAKKMQIGQWLLLSSIILIGTLLVYVLFFASQGWIQFSFTMT